MAETAVVILLPELDPLIGNSRRRYTGDGARGMPPHVTLIIPFVDTSDLADHVDTLTRVFRGFEPLEVSLTETARFPGFCTCDPSPRARLSR